MWKKIIDLEKKYNSFIRPKNYLKLKKYESRKRKKILKNTIVFFRNNSKHHGHIITLGSDINFEDGIENIVSFTKNVNKFISKDTEIKYSINHKKINNISTSGLLYMVGQISKITNAKYKDGQYHLKYSKGMGLQNDGRIKYLFDEIGYWRYFGIKRPYKISNVVKNNYFLSIETGNKSDFALLNKIKNFININVDFLQDDYRLEYQFDDVIKEAMGNSLEHAYHDDFYEVGKEKNKWWICGHYDKQKQSLELVFYDYGIGIRKSIDYNLGEDANKVLKDKFFDNIMRSDADLISMAVEGDLSKYKHYKEHDRGKGFKRFKEFAKASQNNCELTIVSNKGKYKFSYNAQTEEEIVKKLTLSAPIDGMLIKWVINLSERNLNE